jgi:DNA-binding MarR family transcriptional regulator
MNKVTAMPDNKIIDQFWKDCEMANFSREATVLFFHLMTLHRQSKVDTIYLHPAALLSKIVGFTPALVTNASDELKARGYIEYTPAEGTRTSGMYRLTMVDKAEKVEKTEKASEKPVR